MVDPKLPKYFQEDVTCNSRHAMESDHESIKDPTDVRTTRLGLWGFIQSPEMGRVASWKESERIFRLLFPSTLE
eukprot:5120368-Amphidinium_carterae.1